MQSIVHCYGAHYPTGLSDFVRGSVFLLVAFPGHRVHICMAHHPQLSQHLHLAPAPAWVVKCPGGDGEPVRTFVERTREDVSTGRVRQALHDWVARCTDVPVALCTNLDVVTTETPLLPPALAQLRRMLQWKPSVMRYVWPFEGLIRTVGLVVVHVRLPDRFFRSANDNANENDLPRREAERLLATVRRSVAAQKWRPYTVAVALCNHAGLAGAVESALVGAGLVCAKAPSARAGGAVHTHEPPHDAAERYAATLADWVLVGRARLILQFSCLEPCGRSGFSDVPAQLHSVPVVPHDTRPLVQPD
jgi:hypothetical protein